MANKIQVTLEVDDKGSVKLKQFGDEAQKTKTKTESAFDSTNDGVTKMIAGFGKATVAIAAVATAIKTMEMAFQQARIGEGLLRQQQAFENLSRSSGVSATKIIEDMKSVSKGMVDEASIIKAAGTAMMLGIPADKLTDLMRIAEATSRQTGQSVTEAFNDITLAVGRGSKMILDNLGIIVDVEKANEAYAKSLGKSSEALTDTEKKQAFMNATLKAGKELTDKIGESSTKLDGATKLVVAYQDAWNNFAQFIAIKLAKLFPPVIAALDEMNKKMKETIALEKTLLQDEVAGLSEQLKGNNYAPGSRIRNELEAKLAEAKARQRDRFRQQEGTSMGKVPKGFSYSEWREREGNSKDFTPEENLKAAEERVAAAKAAYEKFKRELERAQDIMVGIYARQLELSGNVEEAEIQAIKNKYAEFLKNEALTKEQRLKIEETTQKEILLIQRKYAQQRATQQSQYDEFYKGGSPSEARFLKNDSFKKAANDLDDYMLKLKGALVVNKEYYASLRQLDELGIKRKPAAYEFTFSNAVSDSDVENYTKQFLKMSEERRVVVQEELAALEEWREALEQAYGSSGKLDTAYTNKVKAIFGKESQNDIAKWAKTAKDAGEQIDAVLIQAGESFATGFTDAFMEFAEGTKSAEEAFKQFAASFLREIAKMIMQQLILNAVKAAGSSFFGMAAANGAVWEGGFTPFADGGVVNKPTLGLVGEGKYNEAIVPLPDGRSIPVVMKGGSGGININVNVDGSKGGTRQENDRMAKQIARQVKEEVKLILKDENRHGGVQSGFTYQRAY